MSFSEVGAAIEGMDHGFKHPGRKHFHGGPDRRLPAQVIADLGLREEMVIALQSGVHTIRKIKDGNVYVYGLSKPINVYGISVE